MKKGNKVIKNLSGHSGCKVNLVDDGNGIYVSKMSASKSYNFRLKKQCQKQHLFDNSKDVYTPKIIKCGYDDDLFYFDMQYVKARTMAEYVRDISIMEIANYIRCLFDSLYFQNEKYSDNTQKIFSNKIQSLKYLLAKHDLIEAFYHLEHFDWYKIPKSPCHGDLTLENILITYDKKLYLIDFLDSFYNSWMIDIAKLLQDLELKWSFRNKTINSNMELRLLVAKEALMEEILKTRDGEEKLNAIYHILLLNIIRIYPYAKDKVTTDFLDKAVQQILSKINNKIGVGV